MVPDDVADALHRLAETIADLRDAAALAAVGQFAAETFIVLIGRGALSREDVMLICNRLDQAAANFARSEATATADATANISLSLRNAFEGRLKTLPH